MNKKKAIEIGGSVIIAILLVSFLYFVLILSDDQDKMLDCRTKCQLFDYKVWEYKNCCECFGDNKIIKLEDLIEKYEEIE